MNGHCVDIVEHLDKLREISSNCDTVVEFGVRDGWSTKSLIEGKPKVLISYDVNDCPNIDGLQELAYSNGVNFEFRKQSSHDAEIPECDFLFIDSQHTYDCLKKELQLHKRKAKFIGFHDTVSFPKINKAIEEECSGWNVLVDRKNNNGFLVLERPC